MFTKPVVHSLQVGGHIVYTYNVGNGVQKVVENSRMFNDGRYHYVRFTRTGDSVVLSVDDDLQTSNAATVGGTFTLCL